MDFFIGSITGNLKKCIHRNVANPGESRAIKMPENSDTFLPRRAAASDGIEFHITYVLKQYRWKTTDARDMCCRQFPHPFLRPRPGSHKKR